MAPWQTLEAIPGLIALPAIWQRRLGDDFPAFKSLCLQIRAMLAIHFPCALQPGIIRDVIRQPDGSFIGICRCALGQRMSRAFVDWAEMRLCGTLLPANTLLTALPEASVAVVSGS